VHGDLLPRLIAYNMVGWLHVPSAAVVGAVDGEWHDTLISYYSIFEWKGTFKFTCKRKKGTSIVLQGNRLTQEY